MPNITLSKALRVKNELVRQLQQKQALVVKHNSHREGVEPPFSVTELMDDISTLRASLGDLKAKVAEANLPIYPKLYAIAELKGYLAWLQGVPTTAGPQAQNPYAHNPGPEVVLVAAMTERDVQKEIEEAQADLSSYQDEVDEFNATHFIEWEA